MQSKIKPEHFARQAYIYIRQSTLGQVHNHKESQRLQYRLVDKAKELGWPSPRVIDEDLGRSGAGTTTRPGFSRLLSTLQEYEIGAIFCLEASRLARNSRDWAHLIDYSAITHTLLIDLDGIYDPRNVSDRVFLGMKGTMSQYETGIFRQRAQQAREEKAARGQYYTSLSAGYVRSADRRCEMEPDKRVQQALYLIFKKFHELGSINQVVLWLRENEMTIPFRAHGCSADKTEWREPNTGLVRKIILNPIYAGAYAYGRSQNDTRFVDGQPMKFQRKNLPIEQWKVLIKDHHIGYISWDEYLANRKQLEQNQNKRGILMKGAAKRGPALLVGLLRCRKCGQKLHVRYSGSQPHIPRYRCRGQRSVGKDENCISFSGVSLEPLVEQEVLRVVEPAAISAAQQAERFYSEQQKDKEQSVLRALQQAEYEAQRCFEQYNLTDPKNRLVASTLESRWNETLQKVETIKEQLQRIRKAYQPLSEKQTQALYRLAENLPEAWNHPNADMRLKKRILQTVIKEIVVDITDDNNVAAVIHWLGGKHTQYTLKRRKKAVRKQYLHPNTLEIIRELAEISQDQDIARVLNLTHIKTASGDTWRTSRVREFRQKHNIADFDAKKYAKKGWVNLQQAAAILKIHPETVRRLIKAKVIKARQIIKYSPWIIEKEQLKNAQTIKIAQSVNKDPKVLAQMNPNQLSL